jgi:cell division protease FtsH
MNWKPLVLMLVVTCALLAGSVILVLALAPLAPPAPQETPSIALSELAQRVKDGQIASIDVGDQIGFATTRSQQRLRFRVDHSASVPQSLESFGVTSHQLSQVAYQVTETPQLGPVLSAAGALLPGLLLLSVLVVLIRRRTSSNSLELTGFGRSRARMFDPQRPGLTFAEVAGVDEAKRELQEVVEFLKYPEKFVALGARIPKGVLLVGPPGTGKTLISRAVAGEAGVPFFSISGSEFVEMFVGVGASRVRDLFERAKRHAPCIVFVDEIDAVGRRRGAGLGNGNDEREQTLNQLLVEMDGFDPTTNVIVLAATNRPDVLDPALLRPGRFDRQVFLPAPDVKGRKAILEVHARGKPFDANVDLGDLARSTTGFSGAELANVLNEAAILAARRDQHRIGSDEIDEAVDRVLVGPAAESRLMSEHERRLTAYHEAGHALVARFLDHHDPVHKITIVGRGRAGGYTRFLAPEDRHYQTRSQFAASIASALGGHAAETVVFGEMSTGASNDLERATSLARRMVTEFGMTDRLGVVALGSPDPQPRPYSEVTAQAVDEEVRRLIDHAYTRAVQVIREQRVVLDRVAEALLHTETLQGAELERAFTGQRPAKKKPATARNRRPSTLPVPRPVPDAAITVQPDGR